MAETLEPELEESWQRHSLLACVKYSGMAGFFNFHTFHILARHFVVGRYAVNCRIFSSILGLHPLDASSILP